MKTIVVYDIENDRIRNKIFNACKDYGLEHIQYSAFFGELNHNRRGELKQRIKRTLGKKAGKIMICPVCDKDLRLMEEIVVYEQEEEPVEAEGQ
jgi:CRISPR-associated protein Cas2